MPLSAVQILAVDEVCTVVQDLRRRGQLYKNSRKNLAVFRLSAGCGLRRKEIAGLNLEDIIVTGPRPCIRVRKLITKGRVEKRRARIIPLWWDAGTLEDLTAWKNERIESGAGPYDPLIPSIGQHRICLGGLRRRWITALKSLPLERRRQLTSIHCGRHTFCSQALAAGHSLVAVRDAAGHASIATTNIYLHVVEKDNIPDMYALPRDLGRY
jgi:integrase